MSLFLSLMLVQKMIVAALPLSLSHVCFKIGDEGTGIHAPQFKYCCFISSGRAALQSCQWLKGLFSAVPLSKPGAKISLILLSPNTRSTAFAYRRASDLSPANLGADYNQLLNNSRGSSKYLLPTCTAQGSLSAGGLPVPTKCGATCCGSLSACWSRHPDRAPKEFGRDYAPLNPFGAIPLVVQVCITPSVSLHNVIFAILQYLE